MMSSEPTTPTGLDLSVLDDINGHIFPGIQDFYGKFFANRSWSSVAEETVQALPHYQKQFEFHSPGNAFTWLKGLQASLAERTEIHCSWHEHHVQESGSSDRVLMLLDSPKLGHGVDWASVAVLGLCSHEGSFGGNLRLPATLWLRTISLLSPAKSRLPSWLSCARTGRRTVALRSIWGLRILAAYDCGCERFISHGHRRIHVDGQR